MKYKRVLIKLSGEALGDSAGRGIDKEKLEKVCGRLLFFISSIFTIGILFS